MAKSKKREKVNYLDFTFTVFEKYGIWQISFKNPQNSKIIKRSTKLAANNTNLIEVKTKIIPDTVHYLTGKISEVELEKQKEYTVDEWAKKFFETYKRKVRENIFESNLKHYNKHIKPNFGHRKLKSILPNCIETWQNDLLYGTYKVGNLKKRYKPLTVQKYRSVFLSIMDDAVKNLKLESNPLRKVEAPKIQKKINFNETFEESDEGEIFPFNENEIKIILENANGYLKNFILFMYATGMRPGEIVALNWEDINFERKIIKIYKTMVRGRLAPPKTKASKRDIDMLPLAEEALKKQLELTKGYDFVFLNSSKEPFYSHDIISLRFKKILKANNIKDRKLYNVRHTFASQLVSKGEDVLWISKTLGHKDPEITLKYYSKPIKENDETRLKKINKIGANFGANIFSNGSKADE